MKSIIRNFFGLLVLLSMGWICFGIYASTAAFDEVTQENAATAQTELEREAGDAGAAIGASLGLGAFFCTGIPLFLFSLVVYWQMGRSIQRVKDNKEAERRHQEMLQIARDSGKAPPEA
jgi:hypothetical protein